MTEADIPQSKICSPSSAFIMNQVESDLKAFDKLESSDIVRSLFSIGATNPTAIDISGGLEGSVDPVDQYRIRELLSNRGISGTIWRFVSNKKFMVELCKSWEGDGNFLSLSLITLNEATETEPASTNVRELVRFGRNGTTFLAKNCKTIEYDFSVSDFLQELHDKHVAEVEKQFKEGGAEAITPKPEPITREDIVFRGENITDDTKRKIIKFVDAHYGALSTENVDELAKDIGYNVEVTNDPKTGNLMFILTDIQPAGSGEAPSPKEPDHEVTYSIKFVIQMFGDETIDQSVLNELEKTLNETIGVIENGQINVARVTEIVSKKFDFKHFSMDDQQEQIENEVRFKFMIERVEVPKANKFEFVSDTKGYGAEIIAALSDLECDLPINMSVNDIVMMTNGIFHSKSIKDYRACGAELIGSKDLDDYTSERTWKIFFEMTPEAYETEMLHREEHAKLVKSLLEQHDVKFLNGNSNMMGHLESVDELKAVQNPRPGWIFGIDPGEIGGSVTVFCGWDGEKWLNVTNSVEAAMKALEQEEKRKKEQEKLDDVVCVKKDDVVLFRRSQTEDEVKIFGYQDYMELSRFVDAGIASLDIFTKSWKAVCDITNKMLRTGNFHFEEWFKPVDEEPPAAMKGEETVEPEKKENKVEEKNKVVIKKDGLVFIIRDAVTRSITVFNDETHEEIMHFDCEELAKDYNKGIRQFRAMGDITSETVDIIQSASYEFYNRFAHVEVKVTVSEYLKSCEDSIVIALRDVINSLMNGEHPWDDAVATEKLREITEMEDLVVTRKEDGSWYVEQEPQEPAAAEVAEEVPSADIHDPDVQMNLLRGLFGVADPAITHIQKYLRKHLTEIGHDGYALTETFPTETMIAWSEKPYNFCMSIVKMKDGRFYRLHLAYNNPGLPDQTWLATKDIPGRWVRIGRDIQSGEFKPSFQGRRNNRF